MKNSKYTLILLLKRVIPALFLCFGYSAGLSQNKEANISLEGKTFSIQLYEYTKDSILKGVPIPDEITFQNGQLSSKYMAKQYGFAPGNYGIEKGSLNKEGKNTITFVSTGINDLTGQILFWKGTIRDDNSIEGIMNWISKPMMKIFIGKLKVTDDERWPAK